MDVIQLVAIATTESDLCGNAKQVARADLGGQ